MFHSHPKLRTAAEQLSFQISNDILAGQYEPSCQLSEVAVSDHYGVSRNTLREAFRLLMQDGLLVHFPNRGVFVRAFTVADLDDLYAFRRTCEVACIREIFRSEDTIATCIAAMRDVYAQARTLVDPHDWNSLAMANNNFHMAIFRSWGNQRMARVGNTVMAQSRLAFMTTRQENLIHETFLEHNRRLLHCIESHDCERTVTTLEDYLALSQRTITNLMENTPGHRENAG